VTSLPVAIGLYMCGLVTGASLVVIAVHMFRPAPRTGRGKVTPMAENATDEDTGIFADDKDRIGTLISEVNHDA